MKKGMKLLIIILVFIMFLASYLLSVTLNSKNKIYDSKIINNLGKYKSEVIKNLGLKKDKDSIPVSVTDSREVYCIVPTQKYNKSYSFYSYITFSKNQMTQFTYSNEYSKNNYVEEAYICALFFYSKLAKLYGAPILNADDTKDASIMEGYKSFYNKANNLKAENEITNLYLKEWKVNNRISVELSSIYLVKSNSIQVNMCYFLS